MKAIKNEKDRTHAFATLRNRIEDSISIIGTGIVQNPCNAKLHAYLNKGKESQQEVYRQLVRFMFRLIFLCIAEDRDLLFSTNVPEDIKKEFSVRRFTQPSINHLGPEDVWEKLVLIMTQLHKGCSERKIPTLNSFLWTPFACSWLTTSTCGNEYVIKALKTITETKRHTTIDWHDIRAEDLGSVYESLLELHLEIDSAEQSAD